MLPKRNKDVKEWTDEQKAAFCAHVEHRRKKRLQDVKWFIAPVITIGPFFKPQ